MSKYYNAQAAGDFPVLRAMDEIIQTWGDYVDPSGESNSITQLGTGEVTVTPGTIWETTNGNEIYISDNLITKISSSSTLDVSTVIVLGFTMAGGLMSHALQEVTLNGQTPVALTTPLARCTHVFNNSSAEWGGDIYVYQDDTVTGGVPDTVSTTHMKALAADNQSAKAADCTASNEYLLITRLWASIIDDSKSARIHFAIQSREVGTPNAIFLTRTIVTCTPSSDGIFADFDPVLIVPKNSDWRIIATASDKTALCFCALHGLLAKVVG